MLMALNYAWHWEREGVSEWKLFAADVECIESVGAVGAVFEQVFFGLCEFFAGLIFMEAVAPSADTGWLDSEDKVFVIRAIEERHKALFTCESLIDEQVLFIVRHGVAEIDSLDAPTVPLELVDYPPTEILVVDRIVWTEGGSVEVENDGLVSVSWIVTAKIVNERRYLALELDVKGFDDIEAAVTWLTGDNPVDISDNIVSLCFLNDCEF